KCVAVRWLASGPPVLCPARSNLKKHTASLPQTEKPLVTVQTAVKESDGEFAHQRISPSI
ncbi:MAG: hypothetical protein ONB49_21485, partial [candidate division KSB1 bacterium]|nr:hypothetical protein [candidate division KSB1 bacterium]